MSGRILAVDTTGEFGSIALAGHELLLHSPQGFGGVIFQHIAQLLDAAGLRLEDVEAFAAASGPGAFTGVRIGLAAVKGLAEATSKPAIAVSNLAAVARFGSADLPVSIRAAIRVSIRVSIPVAIPVAIRVAIIDARRGEVYGGFYDHQGRALLPEIVCPFPALLERVPAGPVEFVAQDFSSFEAALDASQFAACARVTAPRAIAAMVARMAQERLDGGDAGDPAGLDANYIRRSDAELLFKPW